MSQLLTSVYCTVTIVVMFVECLVLVDDPSIVLFLPYKSYRAGVFCLLPTLIAINRHIFARISAPKRVKLLNNETTCQRMSPRSPAMSMPCHLLPSPVIARLGINILLQLLLFVARHLSPLLKFPKNAHNFDARGDYDANHHHVTTSSF